MIIAILTPRAGKWNHRWVVAQNQEHDLERTLDVKLADLKSSIRDDPAHGILLTKTVLQPSSGREGPEYVFLFSRNFSEVSKDNKKRCRDRLESLDVAKIVDEVANSPQCETSIVCTHPALAKLEKDLGCYFPNDKEATIEKKKSSGVRRVVISLLFLAILVAGAFLAWSDFLERFKIKNLSLSADTKDQEKLEKHLTAWASFFEGGDKMSEDELKENISLAHKCLDGKEHDSDGVLNLQPPYTVTYTDENGVEGHVSVLSLSTEATVTNDKWQWLAGIDAVQFRKFVGEYKAIQESMYLKLDDTMKIPERMEDDPPLWDDTQVQAKFFFDRTGGNTKSDVEVMGIARDAERHIREELSKIKNEISADRNTLNEKGDSVTKERKVVMEAEIEEKKSREQEMEKFLKLFESLAPTPHSD